MPEPDPAWDRDEVQAWENYNRDVAAAARDAFIAAAADGARQALAANATVRTAMSAFLAATPPAGDPARIVFLYDHLRAVSQAVTAVTNEADGFVRLFAAVIPSLADLLD